jgi:tetratricopeptide (TPR) repeat protein
MVFSSFTLKFSKQQTLLIAVSIALMASTSNAPAGAQAKPAASGKTTAVHPEMHNAIVQRGVDHVRTRQYKEALEDFSEAIKIQPSNQHDYFFRGKVHVLNDDDKAALPDLTKSISLSAENPYALLERGKLYYRQKNYKNAVDDLTKAVKLTPNDPKAHEFRALALNNIHKFDEAANEITTALALVQVSPPLSREAHLKRRFGEVDVASAEKAKAHLICARGQIYFNKPHFPSALKDFDYAIKLDPNNADAYLQRAKTQIALKHNELALPDLARYNNMCRSQSDYKALADTYEKIGEFDKADAAYKLAGAEHPPRKVVIESDNPEAPPQNGITTVPPATPAKTPTATPVNTVPTTPTAPPAVTPTTAPTDTPTTTRPATSVTK